jgi:anti-sigma B factor antagonist
MGNLQYSSERKGDTAIVRIGGSLDAETAPGFASRLRGEIDKGAKIIICAMPELDYIASAGMGVLISTNEELNREGGKMVMASMNDKVKKIFKLLGFDNLFETYGDEKSAIDAI